MPSSIDPGVGGVGAVVVVVGGGGCAVAVVTNAASARANIEATLHRLRRYRAPASTMRRTTSRHSATCCSPSFAHSFASGVYTSFICGVSRMCAGSFATNAASLPQSLFALSPSVTTTFGTFSITGAAFDDFDDDDGDDDAPAFGTSMTTSSARAAT